MYFHIFPNRSDIKYILLKNIISWPLSFFLESDACLRDSCVFSPEREQTANRLIKNLLLLASTLFTFKTSQ